jgi:hypothetical protein
VADKGWGRRFDDPILLPSGLKLVTLKDAIDHLSKTVPKADHDHPKVLTAATCLTNAAEGRDLVMHARIATLQALQRNDASPPVRRPQGNPLGQAQAEAGMSRRQPAKTRRCEPVHVCLAQGLLDFSLTHLGLAVLEDDDTGILGRFSSVKGYSNDRSRIDPNFPRFQKDD